MSRLNKSLLPPIEYLNICLDYNKLTGELRWKERPAIHFKSLRSYRASNARLAGNLAGSFLKGYLRIELDSIAYYVHRLAWKMATGVDPLDDIDHINGIGVDNRFCNLRECTHSQNMRNQSIRKNNTSGFKGVFLHKASGRYTSMINDGFELKYLGMFETKELASMAYRTAAIAIHGEFTRETI